MPFDITVTGRNELGQAMSLAIYGVEFLNHGQGISTEDLTIEDQYTSNAGATILVRDRRNHMNCWDTLRAPLPQRSSKEQTRWLEKCGDWVISSQAPKVYGTMGKVQRLQHVASLSRDGDIVHSSSKDEEESVVASNMVDWVPAQPVPGQANDMGSSFGNTVPPNFLGV